MRKSIPEQSFFSNDSTVVSWSGRHVSNGFVQILQAGEHKKRKPAARKAITAVQKFIFSTPMLAGLAIITVLAMGCAFSFQLSSSSQNTEYTVSTEILETSEEPVVHSAAITNDRILIDSIFAEMGKGVSPVSREKNIEYTVQEGDTFFRIGTLYKIDSKTLKRYNKIDINGEGKAGVRIIIPSEANLRNFIEKEKKESEIRIARELIKKIKPVLPEPEIAKPVAAQVRTSSIQPAPINQESETPQVITMPEIDEFPL